MEQIKLEYPFGTCNVDVIRKKIKNSKSQAHEVQTKSGKQPILQKTFYS